MRQKLSKNLKVYEKDKNMKRMLEKLQAKVGVRFLSEEEYAELEAVDFEAPEAPTLANEQIDAF